MNKPELLAPIQDFTTLASAVQAGADAVFFGVRGYNMRVSAKNFTLEDMPKIMEIVRGAGMRAYLALNTIIYQEEIEGMREVVRSARDAGVDAVICWDLAVVSYAREIGLAVHLSTQASVSNASSALFYKKLGISRIVLARECSLPQIQAIREIAGVEIETFIHGAMCVSISGRCFLSQFSTCHSANRGECRQPCRRAYLIRDVEGEYEFEVGPQYVLSPKDLCTLPFIEELMDAGIDCFKIEGRNKSPEYVYEVTSVYREIIDFIWEHRNERNDASFKEALAERKATLLPRLARVFNRGFSSGFYLGKPLDAWSGISDSASTETKEHVGVVLNYYTKQHVAEVLVQSGVGISVGDTILVQGNVTGNVRATIASMEIDHRAVERVEKGGAVAIKLDVRVRKNDVVYTVLPSNPKEVVHNKIYP